MLSNTLRFSTLLVSSLLFSAPATLGQDLSGLPPCAGQCLTTTLATSGKSCTPTDFACLCKNQDFVTASNTCYTSTCPAKDLDNIQTWAVKTCAAAGVKLAANGVTSAANSVSSAANSATNALTGAGGNHTNSTGSASATPNSTPVNSNPPPTRPNSAVALSAEAVKLFAVGSALLSSLLMA
ncbi:hypothetical protein PGT21_007333 [Puccinia graminis f. sp. tritici]|uniref:CFEM domain-containing protein n=1 Tax=Puccinia graminis f. sp. tritici TaxID=56615 RepID=A0A5B0M558_PUCGR|nr:hypothetical protein PGT21_007333 [Puccinia graminis f. sp. tritici]KAA1123096.1 hypothetical protein PGTUg99_005555 [Puccinia graminis f. sp. tritici]